MNIVRGTPHTVDAGLFNMSYFSYVASFGAFTETSYSTPQNLRMHWGIWPIFLRASKRIPAFTSYTVCVEADGQIYKDSYIFGAVQQCQKCGDRHGDCNQKQRVFQCLQKIRIVKYIGIVVHTRSIIRLGSGVISFLKRIHKHINEWI